MGCSAEHTLPFCSLWINCSSRVRHSQKAVSKKRQNTTGCCVGGRGSGTSGMSGTYSPHDESNRPIESMNKQMADSSARKEAVRCCEDGEGRNTSVPSVRREPQAAHHESCHHGQGGQRYVLSSTCHSPAGYISYHVEYHPLTPVIPIFKPYLFQASTLLVTQKSGHC